MPPREMTGTRPYVRSDQTVGDPAHRSMQVQGLPRKVRGPCNNASERALRPSVAFRKVTHAFRSAWCADLFAGGRSVIDTGRH